MHKNTKIFVNLPVKDLAQSTAFYEALGFTKNPMFSDENASCMKWSDEIIVMLLVRDYYKKFLSDREVIDARTTSGVLLALSMESKEAVQTFADTAKQNGGTFWQSSVNASMPEDMMFGYEVEDLDGHVWEPVWMNPNFNPQQ